MKYGFLLKKECKDYDEYSGACRLIQIEATSEKDALINLVSGYWGAIDENPVIELLGMIHPRRRK